MKIKDEMDAGVGEESSNAVAGSSYNNYCSINRYGNYAISKARDTLFNLKKQFELLTLCNNSVSEPVSDIDYDADDEKGDKHFYLKRN